MATLTNLKQLLYSIRKQMLQRPVFYRGTGVMRDDPSFHDEIRMFEDHMARLSLVMKALDSNQTSLQVRKQNLRRIPRDVRYQAEASIDSQEKEIDEILRLANELKVQLTELASRNSTYDKGQMVISAMETVQHQYHLKHDLQQMIEAPSGPAYEGIAPMMHADTIEGATILVYLALQGLVKVMKKAAR